MTDAQFLEEQTRFLAQQTTLLKWYVWATFVIALAACFALLQETIRSYLGSANLKVSVGGMTSTPFGQQQQQLAHYVRLRIENGSKWNAARNVEMVLERVTWKGPPASINNTLRDVFGLNLTWSHFPDWLLMPQIAAGTSRNLDLGHVLRPADRALHQANGDPAVECKGTVAPQDALLKLGSVVHPFARHHLLEPGDWEIQLRLSGANVPGRRVIVTVHLTGAWHNDPAVFAQQGLSLTVA